MLRLKYFARLPYTMNGRALARLWDKLHLGKLSIFAALSVADLFMTLQLVQAGDGQVYESNPVAEAWLTSYGWIGLSVYKALAMLLVIACALYVSVHRPKLGGSLLAFACLATGAVVGYSFYLAHQDDYFRRGTTDDPDVVLCRSQSLAREMDRQRSYQALIAQIGCDLVERRCKLPEAVRYLESCDRARHPDWKSLIQQNHPGWSDDESVAIHIGKHALLSVQHDPKLMEYVADQLQRDFESAYGRPYRFDLAAAMFEQEYVAPRPDRRASASTFEMSSGQ